VAEDLERLVALADLDRERLAGLGVVDGDDEAIVLGAPRGDGRRSRR
jgi:hypothetical protein